MKTLWKSMKGTPKAPLSENGELGPWEIGEWRKHDGPLEMCESGFHASENVVDAMRYVNAEVLAQVEVRGEHLEQSDKQAWSEMRVVRAWEWTKEDSVALAVYAAELVIGLYETNYPSDDRPRKAIEAAKAWLKNPCEETKAAAHAACAAASAAADAAHAACAAADAAIAAWAAAWAAADAAHAACAAARAADAAYAAWAAASAARAAASAASKGIMDKCHAFVMARLEAKEERRTEEER